MNGTRCWIKDGLRIKKNTFGRKIDVSSKGLSASKQKLGSLREKGGLFPQSELSPKSGGGLKSSSKVL